MQIQFNEKIMPENNSWKCNFDFTNKQGRQIRENAMVFVLYDFTSKIAWFLLVEKIVKTVF